MVLRWPRRDLEISLERKVCIIANPVTEGEIIPLFAMFTKHESCKNHILRQVYGTEVGFGKHRGSGAEGAFKPQVPGDY